MRLAFMSLPSTSCAEYDSAAPSALPQPRTSSSRRWFVCPKVSAACRRCEQKSRTRKVPSVAVGTTSRPTLHRAQPSTCARPLRRCLPKRGPSRSRQRDPPSQVLYSMCCVTPCMMSSRDRRKTSTVGRTTSGPTWPLFGCTRQRRRAPSQTYRAG